MIANNRSPHGRTTHTRAVAERLAEKIVNHWAAQGYSIRASVRELAFDHTLGFRPCEIRTDMVNGLPKDWRGRRAA